MIHFSARIISDRVIVASATLTLEMLSTAIVDFRNEVLEVLSYDGLTPAESRTLDSFSDWLCGLQGKTGDDNYSSFCYVNMNTGKSFVWLPQPAVLSYALSITRRNVRFNLVSAVPS